MTESQAHTLAQRRSQRNEDSAYYVVYEGGEWDCASEYVMDTYYAGNQPVACYVGGKRDS